MQKEERQKYILGQISQANRVCVTTLSRELDVSDDTVRRDLTELDKKGLLTKVHGGAVPNSGISIRYVDRLNADMREKQQMAAKVIPLLSKNDVVLLDGGTSNLEVALKIPQDFPLTVFTNSFPIANALMDCPHVDLNFIGGKVLPDSQVTVGLPVFKSLQEIRPDWTIIGISDIHPIEGLTCPDREEAMIKRAMMERGEKNIVLAGSCKLNKARTYKVAGLSDLDYLITSDDKVDYIKRNWPAFSYQVL